MVAFSRALYSHLAMHSGFDEGGCYGDVTLHFAYSMNFMSKDSQSVQFRDTVLQAYDEQCLAASSGVVPSRNSVHLHGLSQTIP